MSGRAPYFGPNGDCRIAAGEILNVQVTIRTSRDSSDIDLTGRNFALSVYRANDEFEVYSISATGAGTSAVLQVDGDTTRSWRDTYQGVPLRLMVVEQFEDGFSTLSDGGLSIVAASRSLVPGETVSATIGPVVQIVYIDSGSAVQYVSTGQPGPANALSIGTVTEIPAGTAPSAEIVGSTPNQVLNLELPASGASPASMAELLAWATGSATGGPHGDGNYPITQASGIVILVSCPAKLAASATPTATIDNTLTASTLAGSVVTGFIARAQSIDTRLAAIGG